MIHLFLAVPAEYSFFEVPRHPTLYQRFGIWLYAVPALILLVSFVAWIYSRSGEK